MSLSSKYKKDEQVDFYDINIIIYIITKKGGPMNSSMNVRNW